MEKCGPRFRPRARAIKNRAVNCSRLLIMLEITLERNIDSRFIGETSSLLRYPSLLSNMRDIPLNMLLKSIKTLNIPVARNVK